MKETGEIIGIENNSVIVRLNPQGGCPSCHHSAICTVSGTAHRELRLPCDGFNLHRGDLVEIETSARGLLSAALMVFIIPLIIAGTGYSVILKATQNNGWATLGFFLSFAAAEGLLALYDRLWGRKKFYEPRIVKRQISS